MACRGSGLFRSWVRSALNGPLPTKIGGIAQNCVSIEDSVLVLDGQSLLGLDEAQKLFYALLAHDLPNPQSAKDGGKVQAGNRVLAAKVPGPLVIRQETCAGAAEANRNRLSLS